MADTTNYGITKPTVGADDDAWGDKLNTAIDAIDTQMKSNDDAAAAAQSTANAALPKAGGTITGDVAHGDNVKAKFGAGDDLQIYHDGSNSWIRDNGTGNLNITGAGAINLLTSDQSDYLAVFSENGGTQLFYDGAQKLATTSTGVDVAGTVSADGLVVDGNVGIGTSSPSEQVSLYSNASNAIQVQSHNSSAGSYNEAALKFALSSSGSSTLNWDITAAQTALTFDYEGSPKVTIDNNGNVGIGTGSPAQKLELHTAAGYSKQRWSTGLTGRWFEVGMDNATDFVSEASGSGTQFIWKGTGSAERMRIDSSGNLLVGTTDNNVGNNSGGADVGIVLREYGELQASATSACAIFNKQSTDGDAVVFKKDGSTVGSIGSYAGAHLRVGSGETNILFASTLGMLPATSSGTASDGLINIGFDDRRFKDLYLSGGVYLGGTGAANKLDDYEEGSFTPVFNASGTNPTVSYSDQTGEYVKIGNLVHVTIGLTLSAASGGSGLLQVSGLPYSAAGASTLAIHRLQYLSVDISASAPIGVNSQNGYIYKTDNTTGSHDVLAAGNLTANTSMSLSGTYITQ